MEQPGTSGWLSNPNAWPNSCDETSILRSFPTPGPYPNATWNTPSSRAPRAPVASPAKFIGSGSDEKSIFAVIQSELTPTPPFGQVPANVNTTPDDASQLLRRPASTMS